jgi:hypothetical protein
MSDTSDGLSRVGTWRIGRPDETTVNEEKL